MCDHKEVAKLSQTSNNGILCRIVRPAGPDGGRHGPVPEGHRMREDGVITEGEQPGPVPLEIREGGQLGPAPSQEDAGTHIELGVQLAT
eukprot:1707887-Karenia_brevis.AAC.1